MSFLKFIVDSTRPDIRVIDNPHKDKSLLVMWNGKPARGKTPMDVGFFYCPYIPLIKTTAVMA